MSRARLWGGGKTRPPPSDPLLDWQVKPVVTAENRSRNLGTVLTLGVGIGVFVAVLVIFLSWGIHPVIAVGIPSMPAILGTFMGLFARSKSPIRVHIFPEGVELVYASRSRRLPWEDIRSVSDAGQISLAAGGRLRIADVSGAVVQVLQEGMRKFGRTQGK